ncbi:MAG: hypothetical protein ACREF9_16300 [Opitutaceae bacterium]
MLAYVFWHVPRPGIVARDYEAAHRQFHDALWATPIAGLVGLQAFKLSAVPWIGGLPVYEDWHLLDDSAALDTLEKAAITQARQLPHDRIAAMSEAGTAGLYGIRSGTPIEPAFAYWLSKPTGMSYAAFDASFRSLVDTGCCLWGRRLTLGPTPEFCLHAPAEIRSPYSSQPLKIEIRHSHGPR